MDNKTIIEKIKQAFSTIAGKAPIVREAATASTLQRVLGIHYEKVVIYDCENNELMTQTHNGESVYWDSRDTENAKAFKELFDKAFKRKKLTLVCNVSTQVLNSDYPDLANWTKSGTDCINRYGHFTVCNFIVRDERTGKLRMLNDAAWLGLMNHANSSSAARFSAHEVVFFGAKSKDFRSALRAGYQRNKHATR